MTIRPFSRELKRGNSVLFSTEKYRAWFRKAIAFLFDVAQRKMILLKSNYDVLAEPIEDRSLD